MYDVVNLVEIAVVAIDQKFDDARLIEKIIARLEFGDAHELAPEQGSIFGLLGTSESWNTPPRAVHQSCFHSSAAP